MKIRYLGHASFLITSQDGTRIQFDPYEPGGFDGAVAYGPFQEPADIVVVSHEHADHGYVQAVPGNPQVVKGPASQTLRGIEFNRHPAYHDTSRGTERGENVITSCRVDGVTLCHLGDLGHVLSDEEVKQIGEIGVLMIPVGGIFTLNAAQATQVLQNLAPRICIPMHYRTSKVGFPIAPVDEFLKGKETAKHIGASEVEVSAEDLPAETEIWVLEHAL
ncbi:MAG: MBL fold metallo-hydrolase [Armatimonadetes bacterium]|nr:MBL fold metallo-hydrolase [Armatimonadota bacterium]NIO75127.1 MBL fold metallo-hydrolase [Armatimonadota bacterium]NIO95751.1 MBL fold metallo-hydrolase [Armatimonadota bacterium]